jgi:hypothetical protein
LSFLRKPALFLLPLQTLCRFTCLPFFGFACRALALKIACCVLSLQLISALLIAIGQNANEPFFVLSIGKGFELSHEDILLESLNGAPNNLVRAECRRSFSFFFGVTSSARNSDEFQTVSRTPILTKKTTVRIGVRCEYRPARGVLIRPPAPANALRASARSA